MDTASFQFVVFGLVMSALSNFSRSRNWRSTVLLLANIAFLGLLARDPIVLLPMFGFLLLGYCGICLLQHNRFRFYVVSLFTILFAYIWLKKYSFLPDGIFLHIPYFTLGLSYIFFRVLHLLIEARDGNEKQSIGFAAYFLYTLNFTTLISGPIQQYEEFARDQFASKPIALDARVIALQLERIIRGFFKVNVLAMLLHAAQEDALAQLQPQFPLSIRLFAAFKTAAIYPFFLYANFSGYIDIVIAIARLMRVRLPENFNRPFSASSFIDFWNRWHITLSTWLKMYVYNPLLVALMRRISLATLQQLAGVFCFFVTFFLVGIWHGRTSEFIVFGVLQGGGVAINKLWQLGLTHGMGRKGYRELASNPVYIVLGRGMTFSWFAFTLFWFWADWKIMDRAFQAISVAEWFFIWIAVCVSAAAVLAVWEWLRAALLSIKTSEGPVLTSRYARVIYASALGLIALVVTILLKQSPPDIIYKAF